MAKKYLLNHVALIATLLIVCSCTPLGGYCPPAVRATPETKAWLLERLNRHELPEHLMDYLNRIGRQQEAIEANCK